MEKYIKLPSDLKINAETLISLKNHREVNISLMKKWETNRYRDYLKIEGSRKGINRILKKLFYEG
jgi:hypothetical protein